MKIRVTERGIYGKDGELPLGTEIEFEDKDDIPRAWRKRYAIIDGNGDVEELSTRTNPDREDIIKQVMRELDDDDFTEGGKPKVEAVNDELPEGVDPIDSKERDRIWASVEEEEEDGE